MLEKLAAVDGMVHGASRAQPPAARIQELVDRVVAAEKAAAKHQARAVRAEHERAGQQRRAQRRTAPRALQCHVP